MLRIVGISPRHNNCLTISDKVPQTGGEVFSSFAVFFCPFVPSVLQ